LAEEGGGFIRSKNPLRPDSSAGEKLVFWFALGAGAAVSVSGYLLLFPFYVTTSPACRSPRWCHSIIAVLFHRAHHRPIYIGTSAWRGLRSVDRQRRSQLGQGASRALARDEIAKGRVPACPHRQPAE